MRGVSSSLVGPTRVLGIALALLSITPAMANDSPAEAIRPQPSTTAAAPLEDASTIYALGQLISRTLEKFALTPEELDVLWQGLEDGVMGRPSKVDLAAEAERLPNLQSARHERQRHHEREAGARLIAAASTEQNVDQRPSGLVIQPIAAGHGAKPTASDHVSVHYEGRLVDGTVFDSSRARGEPSTFPVRGVIACWTEALQLMRVGERSRIICPPQIAYGERGRPPVIRPDATLIFDIELLGIVR